MIQESYQFDSSDVSNEDVKNKKDKNTPAPLCEILEKLKNFEPTVL